MAKFDIPEMREYKREYPPEHFIVEIKPYSLLSNTKAEKYESGVFDAGGYRWRLSLYPNYETTSKKGYISLFLVLIGSVSGKQSPAEVYATFRLFLYKNTPETQEYLTIEDGSGKVNHFHEEMRQELGFAKFLLRSTFEKRSEGYVWDDCCRIGAEVFVHKGQTKTLDEYLPPRELKNPTSSVRKFRLGSISSKRDPKCLSSDKFHLQGRKWKLSVCQNGEPENKSLSFMLESKEDWKSFPSFYAKFRVRVLDRVHGKHTIEKEVQHWFCSSNRKIVFPDYMPWKTLRDSSKGFIKNDVLTVEVEICSLSVVDAPRILKNPIVL
ncbi:hypothetical protein GBA52_007822 [Prunus armeniaca]|nr:hypothetical protein GBA52_007822 [Prunus armeniaca]